ncbi:MAG: hypothetical protein HHJ15_18155 [Rhodoferax sp.]|uniref:hypothetical protein n=1 Tax=Rhodoferax sp. TaxID=50421 RepID=UPI001826F40D|nr:hypothetical protein [Rhodoferax sp.]NMM21846.1 hypothetical protein [Rhodoferax sp.]
MKLKYRIQEWFADRVSWVQYPDIRNLQHQTLRFKHSMPWENRVGLALFGFVALAFSLAILGVLALGIYLVI